MLLCEGHLDRGRVAFMEIPPRSVPRSAAPFLPSRRRAEERELERFSEAALARAVASGDDRESGGRPEVELSLRADTAEAPHPDLLQERAGRFGTLTEAL